MTCDTDPAVVVRGVTPVGGQVTPTAQPDWRSV
ncbi:MAG: hypothetical protein J07HX64_01177 [halophilic archaeon J07HX64]|nr:MAG: hypothetical protein J07HX64_01177 [halophilic archaeon J07HX64]